MRKQEDRIIVTFHTTTEAIAFERMCREEGIAGRLIPVPKTLSAGCGMAWSAPEDAASALGSLMEQKRVRHQEMTVLKI
ncbi:MAG: DUF3343 domain-containing protein [Lachnospiraceae bacterium]|nr:DUF3343 domain-containing protein [Lachnospiraceae bacterium]